MEDKDKNLLYIANIQRAFVCTVARALLVLIEQMINYCNKYGIKIDAFERSQLNIIQKGIKNITSDYLCFKDQSKSRAFKRYTKIMALVIRQLFSKTDGDYMTMFKFYNYVKTFPTALKEIEPTASEEQDAFSVIFNCDNSNNS